MCITYIEGRFFFMHKNDRLRPWETALLAAVCVTLLTGVWAQGRQSALADKVVRLHVIAASDSAEDQRVKLKVRDALLAYLTPRLEAVSGAQDAAAVIARGVGGASAYRGDRKRRQRPRGARA